MTAHRSSPGSFPEEVVMARRSVRFRYQSSARPAALLIALQDPHQSAHLVASSAIELTRLARGLGIEVARTLQQSRSQGALSALLSEDRLRELAAWTGGPGPLAHGQAAAPPEHEASFDLVLVDGALTPAQQRTLERALGVQVLDRSAVILQVFEQRARTREARLQVELARLLHQAPRIRDDHALGDREGGGGRGGRGHSNVELRKQQNRERTAELRRELAALPARAAVRRRLRGELPQVALVGYTNAGKSSLMRGLSGGDVHVEDAPFATLDTTVRAIVGSDPRVLISDTVGFIANLPHELVASFRATLEEARHADVLLVVADASDPDMHDQLFVTDETLDAIGAGEVPRQLVLNKVDRLHPLQREALARTYPDAWLTSAHDEADMAALRARVVHRFTPARIEGTLFVPYAQGALLAELHREASVLGERHHARGTQLTLRAAAADWARWRLALGA
jgi:GTP-binding protein HflX